MIDSVFSYLINTFHNCPHSCISRTIDSFTIISWAPASWVDVNKVWFMSHRICLQKQQTIHSLNSICILRFISNKKQPQSDQSYMVDLAFWFRQSYYHMLHQHHIHRYLWQQQFLRHTCWETTIIFTLFIHLTYLFLFEWVHKYYYIN